MTYDCLKPLQPAGFFHWFGEIAAIPHGSHKEQQLIAWLQQFARERDIPNEHLLISEVEPYWRLMLAVLAEKE